MARLDASQVAALLAEYGRRSALRGGNPYRSKAFVRAAENLAALAEPLDRVVDDGPLQEIPGVGDAIADIITKLHHTGTHVTRKAALANISLRMPDSELMNPFIPEGPFEERVKGLGVTSNASVLFRCAPRRRSDRGRRGGRAPRPGCGRARGRACRGAFD